MGFFQKNLLVTSLLISCCLLLLLNLTVGTYFENYESIINELIGGEFCGVMRFDFFVPGWFFVFPIFSKLSHLFDSLMIYGICTTLINIFTLTILIFNFLLISLSQRLSSTSVLAYLGVVLLLFVDNYIYIYNLRICFLCLITSYLYYANIKKYKLAKSHFFLITMLCAIGILARLEIAVIVTTIVLVTSIVLVRSLVKFSMLLFALSVNIFIFYKVYEHQVYPQHEVVLQIEKEFDDKQNINPANTSDTATRLKLSAMGAFIQDDRVYTIADCKRMVCSQSLYEYITSTKFSLIYINKFKVLLYDLHLYKWQILLTMVTLLFAAFYYLKFSNNRILSLLKILFLSGFNLSIILTMMVIITVPYDLIACLFSGAGLLIIIFISLNRNKIKALPVFITLFFTAQLISFQSLAIKIYDHELKKSKKAKILKTMLLKLEEQRRVIVFANGTDGDNYPSRLFSPLLNKKVKYYYTDFFLSRYEFFTTHNQEFFGTSYSFLLDKMERIAGSKNAVYLSNEKYNQFIGEYMAFFYHLRLDFIPYTAVTPLDDLKPYTITITTLP